MSQATGTANLEKSTLAPAAVNGASAQPAQKAKQQTAPAGIAGNGQSTIDHSPLLDPDFAAAFAVGFEIFCMTPRSAQKARQDLKNKGGLTEAQLTKVDVQVEKFRQQQEKDRALAGYSTKQTEQKQ